MSGLSFAALAARNAANPAPVPAPLPTSALAAPAAPAPPAAVVDAEPSEARTLFARGVIYTFDTWSVLQAAVREEWGGPESQDKADYLLNAVVDHFDDFSAPAEQALASGASVNVQVPDEEEVWEILEGYIVAEYGAQVEDDSTLHVARRMIALWKQVFLPPAPGTQPLQQAQETVEALKRVRDQVKGTKTIVTRTEEDEGDWSDSDDEDEDEDDHNHDHACHGHSHGHEHGHDEHMDIDPPQAKAEPAVDDDGFTTVPTRRRK